MGHHLLGLNPGLLYLSQHSGGGIHRSATLVVWQDLGGVSRTWLHAGQKARPLEEEFSLLAEHDPLFVSWPVVDMSASPSYWPPASPPTLRACTGRCWRTSALPTAFTAQPGQMLAHQCAHHRLLGSCDLEELLVVLHVPLAAGRSQC